MKKFLKKYGIQVTTLVKLGYLDKKMASTWNKGTSKAESLKYHHLSKESKIAMNKAIKKYIDDISQAFGNQQIKNINKG